MSEVAGQLIFSQDYNLGEKLIFSLYREQEGDHCTVTLYYQFEGQDFIPCKRFFYSLEAEKFQSPYLSWYNLICCSNNYGPIPVVDYMNYAVQKNKKLAATVYPKTAEEYMQMIGTVGDEYYCYPYHTREYQYMLYVSRKGSLSDYFDLDQILSVYGACGIELDAEKMKKYFQKELSYFGNEEECEIQLHDCLGQEELAVTGLLFGYPVESTVALLKKEIDTCGY